MCSEKKTPAAVGAAHEGTKCIGEGTNHNHTVVTGHLENPRQSTGISRVFFDGTRLPREQAVAIYLSLAQVQHTLRGNTIVLEICPVCVQAHDERAHAVRERERLEREIRAEIEERLSRELGELECGTPN